jgi:hypothetical protein
MFPLERFKFAANLDLIIYSLNLDSDFPRQWDFEWRLFGPDSPYS